MVGSFCTAMANVACIIALRGNFFSFMLCFPLQDPEISKLLHCKFQCYEKTSSENTMKKRPKLKKICFQLPLKKECGTTEKFFVSAMLCNPCFHHMSLVQHTATRVKTTVARGILQSIVSATRDLSPPGFFSIPTRRQRAYQDHSPS